MTTHLRLIDAHAHVFAPEKFPYAENRNYTPGNADCEKLAAHMDRIGADHVVVVQPSTYGTDNRATLEAVEILGQDRARAVAVVDPSKHEPDHIQSLWSSGVRGLRANLKTSGATAIDVAKAQLVQLNAQMKGTDMILQIFLPADVIYSLKDTIAQLGRPTILDHFAGLKTEDPNFTETLDRVSEVLALPNVILKTSGLCRVIDYADSAAALAPYIPSLFDVAKGRIIWGSDWPHTGKSAQRATRPLSEIEPFMHIDDLAYLELLKHWCRTDTEFNNIARHTSLNLFNF
ncbi:amidohydrolase family protein [Cognatishimia sp. WU-CL00825]|uniref:amidohydrolase family protein n=1 Tax=Cognatishimia sp. WU-CL00825 TaxID=3127658 RepID=UPI003101FE61